MRDFFSPKSTSNGTLEKNPSSDLHGKKCYDYEIFLVETLEMKVEEENCQRIVINSDACKLSQMFNYFLTRQMRHFLVLAIR